jgi:hypothetical protein
MTFLLLMLCFCWLTEGLMDSWFHWRVLWLDGRLYRYWLLVCLTHSSIMWFVVWSKQLIEWLFCCWLCDVINEVVLVVGWISCFVEWIVPLDFCLGVRLIDCWCFWHCRLLLSIDIV